MTIAGLKPPDHAAVADWSGGSHDLGAFDSLAVVFDNPRQLRYDGEAGKITNADVEHLLGREYRKGWSL